MLTHPTLDKLQALKFTGMATALAEQIAMPDIDETGLRRTPRAIGRPGGHGTREPAPDQPSAPGQTQAQCRPRRHRLSPPQGTG